MSGYSAVYGSNVSKEGNPKISNTNGLDIDELYGLKLEERKRQRVEAQDKLSQTR